MKLSLKFYKYFRIKIDPNVPAVKFRSMYNSRPLMARAVEGLRCGSCVDGKFLLQSDHVSKAVNQLSKIKFYNGCNHFFIFFSSCLRERINFHGYNNIFIFNLSNVIDGI